MGIKFDPFDQTRFATYSEDALKVFDLRNIRKPLFIIKEQGDLPIGGFEWSSYRKNLLISFLKKTVI